MAYGQENPVQNLFYYWLVSYSQIVSVNELKTSLSSLILEVFAMFLPPIDDLSYGFLDVFDLRYGILEGCEFRGLFLFFLDVCLDLRLILQTVFLFMASKRSNIFDVFYCM